MMLKKKAISCVADVATNEVNMDIGFWGAWALLIVTCAFDLIHKRIPLLLIICGGICGGVSIAVSGAESKEVLNALMPGVLLLTTAFLSREKVGYGDGLLLVVLGMLEGAVACLGDLLIGLLLVAVFGVILFILGKGTKETTVPFVPFVLAAHALRFFAGL